MRSMNSDAKNCATSAILNRGDLKRNYNHFPEMYWDQRIIAQGYRVLIAGAPKVGKSDFFLEMALRAASGGVFLGKRFPRPLKVLYLQSEIHEAYLNERLEVFETACSPQAVDLIAQNFYISGRLTLDLMLENDWVNIQKILLNLQPDIVGIDPIISFSSIDENSSKEVSQLLYKRIVNLQTSIASNPAFVLIHHLKKPKEKQDNIASFFDIRGSGAWQGWYDTGIMLSKRDSSVVLSFDTRHQKSPPEQRIQLNRTRGRWEHTAFTTHDSEQKLALALQFVIESPDGLATPFLRDILMNRLGIARRTAYKIIEQLKSHPDVRVTSLSEQHCLLLPNITAQNEGK